MREKDFMKYQRAYFKDQFIFQRKTVEKLVHCNLEIKIDLDFP